MSLEFVEMNSLPVVLVNCDNQKAMGNENDIERGFKNQKNLIT